MERPTIKVIHHHDRDEDPECMCDLLCVSVHLNGECIAVYGDDYHDSGGPKSEAVAEFLSEVLGDIPVKYDNIADSGMADNYMCPHEVVDGGARRILRDIWEQEWKVRNG